jgi:hypothetical protein
MFLQARRGCYKSVQLRYSRRSLIDPKLVNCPSPVKLYSIAFGGVGDGNVGGAGDDGGCTEVVDGCEGR